MAKQLGLQSFFKKVEQVDKTPNHHKTTENEQKNPVKNMLIGKKQRRFNSEWLEKYGWLRYSVSKDALYCACCTIFGKTDAKEKTFTFASPVTDWSNLSHLVHRHFREGSSHYDCEIMGLIFCDIANKKRESIASTISSYHQELVCKNRHILFKIIEVIILCGRQNIPLRGRVDQKSNFVSILNTIAKSDDILARHLAESKNPISETPESKTPSYMSPDIQNEIIDLCALSVCVRYIDVSDGNVTANENFLGFVHAKSTKAEP
ncbi:hypothetical protein KUTeg_006866 [Tegillarca granosa]|uniref:TTF-type domain-containing protein n=1 Tax=Tegillarca granosa TaxID=220873 RepID=A0ABQ9FDJ5_TEGGR|nr:hypothetical protein KUTeg_006866 [Tegillarca granosa]